MKQICIDDLNLILEKANESFEEMRSKTVFITGGTGFFGKWILESFLYANKVRDLDINLYVLTRNVSRFRSSYPHLAANACVTLIEGDIATFEFPTIQCSYLIHAATDADTSLHLKEPEKTLLSMIEGTRRVLQFAKYANVAKLLLVSSGGVYGKQPSNVSHMPEEYLGASDCTAPESVYSEGKRVSELLSSIFAKNENIELKIARCFAFVGPYLPLDRHYAAGNFVKDAIAGNPIVIKGDGSPLRSYMYAADLAIWLFTILTAGRSSVAYNVGSDEPVSIKELAVKIQNIVPNIDIEIQGIRDFSQPVAQYVPSVSRAKRELGLDIYTDLETALQRTFDFSRGSNEKD